MVGRSGPYHDPGSRWSRWGCEEHVSYKGIVYFITLAWLVTVCSTMILALAGVDGDVKGKLDVKV